MNQIVKFTIDGVDCMAEKGTYIVDAAKENGIFIPTLCNYPGVKPKGSCRICSVKINGRLMTACTTPVSEGMVIENHSEEIEELRKSIIELLFVEGNHFCPACEKGGNCELQALAYRYKIMAPRYPFAFPQREVDASSPLLVKDQNRCILCKRCIRAIKDEKDRTIFAYKKRSARVEIGIDPKLGKELTPETAQKAMDICPVGALLVREKGFDIPIGERKYDKMPIGADIEKIVSNS
ncbi:MAG TPA: NADP oxidoreductase [Bacteroidales bacterium]|jgi:[NiFe] hydrogenase diaphorase moiety small subunit|nr:NADP oxidoreductase [Bacteroidales bacterium]